jgi:hypothetical protein
MLPMTEMNRYCPDCDRERLFEQHHAADGTCPDTPGGQCQEWFCTECGAAIIAGSPPAAVTGFAPAAPRLARAPRRRVA